MSYSTQEYGMSLVNEYRNKDAVYVLKRVHNNELKSKYFTNTIDGEDQISRHLLEMTSTSNLLRTRFKLVTAMSNSGDCKSARKLIEEGLDWIKSIETKLNNYIEGEMNKANKKEASTVLSLKNANLDNKAYFLIAKSRCSEDVVSMASSAYEAATTRPQMEYAINYAQSVVKIVEQVQSNGLDPQKVMTDWEVDDDSSQKATLSFRLKE